MRSPVHLDFAKLLWLGLFLQYFCILLNPRNATYDYGCLDCLAIVPPGSPHDSPTSPVLYGTVWLFSGAHPLFRRQCSCQVEQRTRHVLWELDTRCRPHCFHLLDEPATITLDSGNSLALHSAAHRQLCVPNMIQRIHIRVCSYEVGYTSTRKRDEWSLLFF